MKQLISMPSTKAGEFLYTDFSVTSTPDNPKIIISKFITYIKNVLKTRLYLCQRDMDQFFAIDPSFFSTYLKADSSEELWRLLAKQTKNNSALEKLEERQMLSLFTKIIIELTKLKNKQANHKYFKQFAQTKNLIEWLEEQIVRLEETIRDQVKEKAVLNLEIARQFRERQFKEYETAFKNQIDFQTKKLQSNLAQRQKNEKTMHKSFNNTRVQEQIFLYRPSKKLSQAKDISLLAKLAPYKGEKKRPYQCSTLQNSLEKTVNEDKTRMKQEIIRFKEIEARKIRQKHKLEKSAYLDKLYERNREALSKMEMKKEQLNKSQKVKLHNLLEENDRITRERVKSLRNSLQAYSKRDETKQIKKIMQDHRDHIQFVNNVEDIGRTQEHANICQQKMQGLKYSTIDIREHLRKKKDNDRYNDEMIERKILRKVKRDKNHSTIDTHEMIMKTEMGRNRQKSLADLYDQDLKEN